MNCGLIRVDPTLAQLLTEQCAQRAGAKLVLRESKCEIASTCKTLGTIASAAEESDARC